MRFWTRKTIAEIVAKWTGIPVTKIARVGEGAATQARGGLGKRVIGQKEARQLLQCGASRARRTAGSESSYGSFIFLGHTGVGKTRRETLGEFLFDDDGRWCRLDMSEYMEKHAVARMMCAAGYVGYEEGGQLTEAIRRRPIRDPVRRNREGASGWFQHPAADSRRRPSHRFTGADGGLQEHRTDQ